MKKIFYTFMAMTAALSVVGCAKELEESAQTSGNAPEEESGYIVLGASLPDSEDPAGDTKTFQKMRASQATPFSGQKVTQSLSTAKQARR